MGQWTVDGASPWTHGARHQVVSDREGRGDNEGYMKRRHFVAAMGTAGVGGSAIVGSGAFSRVESQRQVKIETVGDEDAYLRLTYHEFIHFDCEAKKELLWVTNQLKSAITEFEFEVVENAGDDLIEIEVIDKPESLDVGEKGAIVAKLNCPDSNDNERTVNFNIRVSGEDLEVKAHRTDEITITCTCPEETAWAIIDENGDGPNPTENRLNELEGMNSNKWGWYMPYEVGADSSGELWAAAGNNKLENGCHVGDVSIGVTEDDELTVETGMNEGTLEKSHLYVDENTDRLVDVNAAPGQLGYDSDDEEYDEGENRYIIDLNDIDENLSDGDEIIIALHGEVAVDCEDIED